MASEEKYNELHSFLKENKMQIRFMKKNGESRLMNCTLNPDLLPPVDPSVTIVHSDKYSKQVIRVFDLDKQAWRSFRIDSVSESKIL